MANIRIIKRRIKSAQNISQMTKAMEMVAASKMKKAQDFALQGKPYADKIYQVVRELASRTDKTSHPLLSISNQSAKKLGILISTNKGLCGGLNTNLFRYVNLWMKNIKDIDFISIGKKGERFIIRSNQKLIADFSELVPFYNSVGAVSKFLVDGFIIGNYSEVYLIYNTFINALKQQPTVKKLLPLSTFDDKIDKKENNYEYFTQFLIEPTVDEVLDALLPHYIENQVRSAIYEAEASEHSARMIAMKNASDAANDLIFGLTLIYNKARQEKITYEIADIVTARLAVEI